MAQEMCRLGLITLNNHAIPPARSIKVGDDISIRTPGKNLTIKILQLPQRGKPNVDCYEIINQEILPEDDLF
jgi:ribosomal 50S subunit-recycling heat shock protein